MRTNRKALRGVARWVSASSVATLLLAGGLAWATGAIPDGNGVINACYNTSKGNLRVIDPSLEACNDRETPISWSHTGLPGIDGSDGTDGQDGLDGVNGVDGQDGKTLLNGTGAPGDKVGGPGDFYLDTEGSILYGPKAEGGWGEGTSLIGPAGANGTDGTDGADGADGAPGPPGPAGPAGAAKGYALVNEDGNRNSNYSSAFVLGIAHPSTGVYCFDLQSFVLNTVANLDAIGGYVGVVSTGATYSGNAAIFGCPDSFIDAVVVTHNLSGQRVNAGFWVLFN